MSSPRSVPAPTDRCAWFHRFTSSWPILTSDVLAGGSHKSTRMRPARHAITSTAMFARRAARVSIPINNPHCFIQRFSPTGFILNASTSNGSSNRSALAFRLKPIRSVQSQAKSDLPNRQIPSALILLFSITVRVPVIQNERWIH